MSLGIGFVTILYAPLHPFSREPPGEPITWLLRVVLFKCEHVAMACAHACSRLTLVLACLLPLRLMIMAGLVKLQANCPSWEKLTALDYHYATQVSPPHF